MVLNRRNFAGHPTVDSRQPPAATRLRLLNGHDARSPSVPWLRPRLCGVVYLGGRDRGCLLRSGPARAFLLHLAEALLAHPADYGSGVFMALGEGGDLCMEQHAAADDLAPNYPWPAQ